MENLNILIVEDDEDFQESTSIIFKYTEIENKNINILQAYSAEEAIQILEKKYDIALIFLDIKMESENAGFFVLQHLREKLKNKDTRVIIMTGQQEIFPEKNAVKDYDIQGYFDKKDVDANKLLNIVHANLKNYLQLKNNFNRDGVQVICDIINIYLSMLDNDFLITKDNLIEKNADLIKLENEIQSFFRVEDSKKKLKEGTTELKLLGEGFNYENLIISQNRNYQISFMSEDEVILNKDNFIKEFKKRLTQFLEFKEIPEYLEKKIKENIN